MFKNILMCKPKYFDVIHYKLNEHMLMNKNVNLDLAYIQWNNLKNNIIKAGVDVKFIKPQKNLVDMVFAANGALIYNNKALISNFNAIPRKDESKHYYDFFKSNINILGSTASYLVKNSSIPKLLKKKIYFHIDLQWYNTEIINYYIYHKMLFNVDNTQSYNINLKLNYLFKFLNTINFNNKINNTTLNESLTFKIFRIPLIGLEVSILEIFIYKIISIILFIIIFKSKKFINKLYIKYK